MGAFVVLALVAFTILRPFLYDWLRIGPRPSLDDKTVSELLALLVTVLSFAIAVMGVAVYELVKNSLKSDLGQELKERIDDATSDFHARTDEALSDFRARTDEALNNVEARIDEGMMKLYSALSDNAFNRYAALWQDHSYSPHAPGRFPPVKNSVEQAINYAAGALIAAQRSAERGANIPDLHLTLLKNNYAYHLATRRAVGDRAEAYQYVDDLKKNANLDDSLPETLSWIYLRFSAPGTPGWDEGIRWFRTALALQGGPAEQAALKDKYRGVMHPHPGPWDRTS